MMSEKGKKIEDLIKEAFRLQFYPHRVYEEGRDYDFNDYEDVANIIKDASNFDEARNMIVDAAQKNPALMMPFVRSFVEKNRKEGEDWNENSFDFSTLKMRPIDIDNIVLDDKESEGEDLFSKANRLAASLGYDVNNEGLSSLIADYLGGREGVQYGKQFFEKGIRNDIRKRKANAEKYLDFLEANGYVPTITDEQLVNDLSSILSRVNEINEVGNRGGAEKFADQLFKPHTTEREAKGQERKIADGIADLAGLVGAGKIGTADKAIKTKLGFGTGLGALLDYGHGIADSLTTKRTYIDTPEKKLVENGDVIAALKDWKTPVASVATGLAALFGGNMVGGGRAVKGIFDNVSKSKTMQNAKKKVSSALDYLFDGKQANKALNAEKKALQQEHFDYLLKGAESGISEAEDVLNVKRLAEIAERETGTKVAGDALKKLAETGATLLFENPPQGMKKATARLIPYLLGDWQ